MLTIFFMLVCIFLKLFVVVKQLLTHLRALRRRVRHGIRANRVDFLFSLIECLLLRFLKQALAKQTNSAAKENSGENDKSQASGNNDSTIGHVRVDAKD